MTPQDYQSSFVRFARHHFKLSQRLEIATVGVGIGILSFFLPWDDGFIWQNGTVLAQNEMNFFNLFAANDPTIIIVAFCFIAGMLLSILNRWFVIIEFIGMMGLTFTMSSYILSKLAAPNNLLHQTSFGIGYFLGWLSLLISITMLIDERRGIGPGLPPSERLTWRYWRR